MSTLCPYSIIKGDDGLSVKVEWDVHYLTDEQIGIIRKYIAETEAENEKLRELVRNVEHYERFGCQGCPHSGSCGSGTLYDEDCAMSLEIERGKRELGVEVDV